jgi:hypothetical protein
MTEGRFVDQLSSSNPRHSSVSISWSSIRRVVSIDEKGGHNR